MTGGVLSREGCSGWHPGGFGRPGGRWLLDGSDWKAPTMQSACRPVVIDRLPVRAGWGWLSTDGPAAHRQLSCNWTTTVPMIWANSAAVPCQRTFLLAIEASSTAIFCRSTFLASAWAQGSVRHDAGPEPGRRRRPGSGPGIFTDASNSRGAKEPGKSGIAAAVPCHRRFFTALQRPGSIKVDWHGTAAYAVVAGDRKVHPRITPESGLGSPP